MPHHQRRTAPHPLELPYRPPLPHHPLQIYHRLPRHPQTETRNGRSHPYLQAHNSRHRRRCQRRQHDQHGPRRHRHQRCRRRPSRPVLRLRHHRIPNALGTPPVPRALMLPKKLPTHPLQFLQEHDAGPPPTMVRVLQRVLVSQHVRPLDLTALQRVLYQRPHRPIRRVRLTVQPLPLRQAP